MHVFEKGHKTCGSYAFRKKALWRWLNFYPLILSSYRMKRNAKFDRREWVSEE